jgi:hypothetical protein
VRRRARCGLWQHGLGPASLPDWVGGNSVFRFDLFASLEMKRAASCLPAFSLAGGAPPLPHFPPQISRNTRPPSTRRHLRPPCTPSPAPLSATSCAWRARLGVGDHGAVSEAALGGD